MSVFPYPLHQEAMFSLTQHQVYFFTYKQNNDSSSAELHRQALHWNICSQACKPAIMNHFSKGMGGEDDEEERGQGQEEGIKINMKHILPWRR